MNIVFLSIAWLPSVFVSVLREDHITIRQGKEKKQHKLENYCVQ